MGIEIGGGFLFVEVFRQNSLLGKAEAIIIVVIVNYFLSKFLVFRRKEKTQE
jgi:putative flippase GtrA